MEDGRSALLSRITSLFFLKGVSLTFEEFCIGNGKGVQCQWENSLHKIDKRVLLVSKETVVHQGWGSGKRIW